MRYQSDFIGFFFFFFALGWILRLKLEAVDYKQDMMEWC